MTEVVRAHAKINLSLEILGRRPDGYHELRSVLHAIELHDVLHAEKASDLSLSIEMEEKANDEALLPPDNNLVIRAARCLRAEAGITAGARLRLRKCIPMAAGLGGGSSDAAATLRALNRLWRLNYSDGRLAELGASLGADVPFFIRSTAALASGRGDHLKPLPCLPATWLVLVTPRVSLPNKTSWAYGHIAQHHFSSGAFTLCLAHELQSGQVSLEGRHLRNAFEPIVVERVPAVQRCRHEMWRAGITGVSLTGAGPSLFALLSDAERAHHLVGSLQERLGAVATVLLSRTGTAGCLP